MSRFRIAGGFFTVRLWPSFLTVLMLSVLCGLGCWQIARLHWKENLIARIGEQMHLPPIDVSAVSDPTGLDYRLGVAHGTFHYEKEIYLAQLSLQGEGGWHVLTPLEMDHGRWLLVDRGWVPYDKELPATRASGDITGPLSVKGVLRAPHKALFRATDHPENKEWFAVDLAKMAEAQAVKDFFPFVLEADATPNPGGFPLGGQTRVTLPNNHFGYALTWFGLALALFVIYGVSGFRKVSSKP